ncbi:hypothetical protein WMF45_06125 [Sorangium sp. So ce448]|uniref:hypothetical protein n=1 Tax=Sorangium sp. So ce448 TaxID=3133314 RepID=UPI003F5EC10A
MEGKRNSRSHAAALVAVAGHLGLVVMGALQIHPEGDGWPARALAVYGALSGAESGYAFFADSITPLPRASFHVSGAGGATLTDALESGASRETEIRILNLITPFLSVEDPTIQRSIAASWAGKVLARHPAAQSILVRLETCDLPTMREYREGKRSSWNMQYEAKFMTRSKLRASPEASGGAR